MTTVAEAAAVQHGTPKRGSFFDDDSGALIQTPPRSPQHRASVAAASHATDLDAAARSPGSSFTASCGADTALTSACLTTAEASCPIGTAPDADAAFCVSPPTSVPIVDAGASSGGGIEPAEEITARAAEGDPRLQVRVPGRWRDSVFRQLGLGPPRTAAEILDEALGPTSTIPSEAADDHRDVDTDECGDEARASVPPRRRANAAEGLRSAEQCLGHDRPESAATWRMQAFSPSGRPGPVRTEQSGLRAARAKTPQSTLGSVPRSLSRGSSRAAFSPTVSATFARTTTLVSSLLSATRRSASPVTHPPPTHAAESASTQHDAPQIQKRHQDPQCGASRSPSTTAHHDGTPLSASTSKRVTPSARMPARILQRSAPKRRSHAAAIAEDLAAIAAEERSGTEGQRQPSPEPAVPPSLSTDSSHIPPMIGHGHDEAHTPRAVELAGAEPARDGGNDDDRLTALEELRSLCVKAPLNSSSMAAVTHAHRDRCGPLRRALVELKQLIAARPSLGRRSAGLRPSPVRTERLLWAASHDVGHSREQLQEGEDAASRPQPTAEHPAPFARSPGLPFRPSLSHRSVSPSHEAHRSYDDHHDYDTASARPYAWGVSTEDLERLPAASAPRVASLLATLVHAFDSVAAQSPSWWAQTNAAASEVLDNAGLLLHLARLPHVAQLLLRRHDAL